MRMILIGTAVLYAVGVVATALAHAMALYLEGWGPIALAWRALELGLAWPVTLATLLTEVRF